MLHDEKNMLSPKKTVHGNQTSKEAVERLNEEPLVSTTIPNESKTEKEISIPLSINTIDAEPLTDDGANLPVEDSLLQTVTSQNTQQTMSAMERSRSLWRDLPPSDPNDPVEHTDGNYCYKDPYPFIAIGASRRGRSHAHDAKYREDAFKLDYVRDWMLMAVADGQGAKSLARVGSNIAAKSAIDYMKKALSLNCSHDEIEKQLRGALAGAMVHALAELCAEASRRERPVDDFSTTLLLVAFNMHADISILGTAQVGDGGMAAKKQDGSIVVLGLADRGSYAGESLFLTNREAQLTWDQRIRIYNVQSPLSSIIIATDGVWDDYNEPYGKLEALFELVDKKYHGGPEQLLEWLNYERQGSFDDRTLVALFPINKSKTDQ
jgi:hypothetical protein